MAITDIARYTHLSPTEIRELADEPDAIRRDVEDSLGAHDAAYIRRTIMFQRVLGLGARVLIAGSRSPGSRRSGQGSARQGYWRQEH